MTLLIQMTKRSTESKEILKKRQKLQNMAADKSVSVRTSTISEVESESFEFLWTLKNFSLLGAKFPIAKSSNFRGGPKSNHLWQLEIHPNDKRGNSEYLGAYLRLVAFGNGDNTKGRKINLKYQMNLLKEKGVPGRGYSAVRDFAKEIGFGWPEFIATSELISPSKGLLVNDTLKLLCSITIIGELKHDIGNSFDPVERRNEREHQVCSDFGKLFKDSVCTDFALKTNSTTFKTHKTVLAARSSVFSAMFTHTNIEEMAVNSVEIVDFDDDVVKALLEYLYTGQTERLAELAIDLFKIADKYDVPGLKEDCEFSIAENLTVENASHVLVMAHTHNANSLKSRVVDYINHNKEGVTQTKSFQQAIETHGSILYSLLFKLN